MKENDNVIENLERNKTAGLGFINAWALISGNCAIGKNLQGMCNDRIQEEFFPNNPNEHKNQTELQEGDTSAQINHPPVSVKTSFAKVFERLLLNELVEYLDKHELLTRMQFRYQCKVFNFCCVVY